MYTTMKITLQEGIKKLCEMAEYVHYADVSFGGENFWINEGTVFHLLREREIKEKIFSVAPKMVTDITVFFKKFIPFSEETGCCVDPMQLNTPDTDWYWVINSRAYCGKAMVRYRSRTGLIVDPEKDRDRLEALGFELTQPGSAMQLL